MGGGSLQPGCLERQLPWLSSVSWQFFTCGLSQDWREAAEIRNNLVRSLVNQVPAVKSGTNFVFLDIVCSHKRAEVIRRDRWFTRTDSMLYADQTLGVGVFIRMHMIFTPILPTGGSHARWIPERRQPEAERTVPHTIVCSCSRGQDGSWFF